MIVIHPISEDGVTSKAIDVDNVKEIDVTNEGLTVVRLYDGRDIVVKESAENLGKQVRAQREAQR